MGPQRDGRLGRDNGDPRAGRSPQQRPRVPQGWVGGAHHDGNAGEEHSRNKLPEPGEASRRKLRSQVIRRHPQTPGDPPLSRRDAQGWLVSGEGMRRDGIEGKSAGARLMRWGLAQPLPITLPPPSTHIDAHLSPRGSRTANLISLPKTWLICGHRRGGGSQGEAGLARSSLRSPLGCPGIRLATSAS